MKLTDQLWGEQGQFKVQGKRIAESEAREKFEWISLKKIIQVSSNIGAAKLALKLGVDPYYKMLLQPGFRRENRNGVSRGDRRACAAPQVLATFNIGERRLWSGFAGYSHANGPSLCGVHQWRMAY